MPLIFRCGGIKIDQSKLKAYGNDNLHPAKMMEYVLVETENIAGKRKNAGYQYFLFFPTTFS